MSDIGFTDVSARTILEFFQKEGITMAFTVSEKVYYFFEDGSTVEFDFLSEPFYDPSIAMHRFSKLIGSEEKFIIQLYEKYREVESGQRGDSPAVPVHGAKA